MKGEKEDITDDIVFEIGLIRQIEINIDYILMSVKKYHDSHCDDFVASLIPKLIIDLNYGENNDTKYIYDK